MLLCDKNPVGIIRPCIKIAENEVLFEKYRMSLKRDKDAIEIQGDDAIKRNRLFFDFMLRMFNNLNQLYEKEKSLLIDTILKYQSRKESAKENTSKPSPSRKESAKENTSKPSPSRKESAKENKSKPYPKKGWFVDETNRTSQANSDSNKTNSNAKKIHVMKQGTVKKNMLKCVIVGEKVILILQTKNQMKKY